MIERIFQIYNMIEKRWSDVLKISTSFYGLSVSRNLFSKTEKRQFVAAGTKGWDNLKAKIRLFDRSKTIHVPINLTLKK